MSEETKNFIDKLSAGDNAGAGEAFKDALRVKVGNQLDQARKELADLQADQEKKYRTSGTRDEVINLQRRIDRGETDINREAANNESPTGASLVNPNSAFGKSQGYTGGNPNPHTPTGWSGSTKGGNGGNGGNGGGGGNPTGSPGSEGPGGSDEMGSFRRGGLAGILGF